MSDERESRSPRLPPRWFIHPRLVGAPRPVPRHRWPHRIVAPEAASLGALRLTANGRRSGRQRSVFLGYVEDGPNLVTMAMNGWGDGEPAWWLNLQAHPDARVDLADGPRLVRGRAAVGAERSPLWARWREMDANLDAYAALRSSQTAVVILEPRAEEG